MFASLSPSVNVLEASASAGLEKSGALEAALTAAESGGDATTPMLPLKGRASYLGERSIGHQDPGATTVALLIAAATRAPL